jgi:hypothetical protein
LIRANGFKIMPIYPLLPRGSIYVGEVKEEENKLLFLAKRLFYIFWALYLRLQRGMPPIL